jgi:ATP-binding protein involved in chromosome partitioning
MPPGFGDTLLDAARYLPRAEYVVVTTPSELTLATTRKMLELLRRLELPVLGLVENLRRDGGTGGVDALAAGGDQRLLGAIGYDEGYEACLGSPERLRGTGFFRDVQVIATALGAARA